MSGCIGLVFGITFGWVMGRRKKYRKRRTNLSTGFYDYNVRLWAGKIVPNEVWEVLNKQWSINHPGEPTPLTVYDEFLVYLRENKAGIYQPRFTSNKQPNPPPSES